MDTMIKELMDKFLNFLVREFKSEKHLRHIQFEKWSLTDNYIPIRLQDARMGECKT